ncbi:MAG: nuclear transport factor 2 family protein [Ekhidna sp.]|nr:nuclear transport factor 2 family protein [Ekhidna sp.]
MKQLFFFLISISSIICCAQSSDELNIRKVLADQQACWNEGDLECFMEGYWKSDRLIFIGSKGVTYGWQKTLDNYKSSYPNRTAMGQLTFDLISLEPLSEDFWSVIGKWTLNRENDRLSGHFSLIFRRLGQEWVIISDHSS